MQVVVGRVLRPHGVRGEVVVDPRTDQAQRRFAPGSGLACPDGTVLAVASSRPHANRWLLRFVGVDGRDAAEALRGTVLSTDADDAVAVDADEFPVVALVGLHVRDVSDRALGVVHAVEHSGWQDLLVVETAAGRHVRVPFVTAIVPTVDLDAGVLVIDPPPGLLDET